MKQSRIVSTSFSSVGTTYLATRDEAKTQCIISDSDTSWNDYIDDLLLQCSKYIQKITGCSMVSQTVTAVIDYESEFSLPYPVVSSLTSASLKTDLSTYETMTANVDYEYSDGRFWAGTNGRWKLVYTVTAEPGLKQALLNEIAYRFEHRGDEKISKNEKLSTETMALIEPYIDMEWLA